MSNFFNFSDEFEEDEREEKKLICEHEKDWDWPQLIKDGHKYKAILNHLCKKCGEFYR